MTDYGDILRFLAEHPPESEAARLMHASLLELMAEGLRQGDYGSLRSESAAVACRQAEAA